VKGLLLSGGRGTRLRPLTYAGNKHLLPIANKPMLLYGLEHLRDAGIKEVGVVLGPIKEGVKEVLGDGSSFDVEITYIDQPEPRGLAHAVSISREFMGGEPFAMYLGDNLLKQGVGDFISVFEHEGADCVVGVSPVANPSAFGIVEVKDGEILSLAEKPKAPKSNLALIGVYIFGPAIFDAVKKITPSWRNELEITDAIQELLTEGKKVRVERVKGWWKDTGRPEDILEANQLVLADLKGRIDGEVADDAQVTGSVVLGQNSKVIGSSRIRGPAIIGRNCTIGPNVYVGPYTSIGDECTLKDTEIENSIVMKGCRIESGRRIVDSLIGNYSTITNGSVSVPKGYKFVFGDRTFAQV
jgi:glucose-1-phosphate thymidylyltransferase